MPSSCNSFFKYVVLLLVLFFLNPLFVVNHLTQNVSCYVRMVINTSMGNYLPVKTAENEFYRFDLDKLEHNTRIHGDEYNEFLEDYNMERSDIVMLAFQPGKDYLDSKSQSILCQ